MEEPCEGGHPERREYADDVDERSGVALGRGCFWSVGLEGHACLRYWTGFGGGWLQ